MTFLADAPPAISTIRRRANNHIPMQVLRFGAVGALNTALDVVVLNLLLWLLAAHTTGMVLFLNAVAYAVGAVNSFCWNKRWTFQQSGPATGGEVLRFGVATLGGMALNDILLWAAGQALLPVHGTNRAGDQCRQTHRHRRDSGSLLSWNARLGLRAWRR